MKRPTGITILALLLIVFGLALGVQASAMISHHDIGTSFHNAHLQRLLWSTRFETATMLWAALSVAVFSLVIGAGLWLLKLWAWRGVVLVMGIALGRAVISYAAGVATNSSVSETFVGAFWFPTLCYGTIIVYFLQLNVRRAFTGRKEYYDAYGNSEPDHRERLRATQTDRKK